MRGLGRRRPLAASAFVLASLSFIGVPFTAGFAGKRLLLDGLFDKGSYVPAALVLLGTAVAVVYLSRVIYLLFAKGHDAVESEVVRTPPSMVIPAAALAAGLVVLGVLSYLVTPALVQAARSLILRT
jgi:multicomponent Na+:H+ antiporter subunit D